ncbi:MULTISPECIES: bifunctional 3'-5' exonuclease/DNA polymerase [unclassified Leifsonia]|uniref:bifunctional 3'-5' exonuclease/DNA polymerase n=1 Tax=unclassified Leifsonia TaxID=2663824 RepID=UPI0008A73195|nr:MULTISPECIES: bifunctional 3'-5' exonuclease/DNA polymerase [unclassified Leifsonia]SEH85213.1 DNA polymerase-1 [Leifsonia sp. CL154]SFL47734.1 DNA polymerase-1 [Leifsonia sp. CL147]
MHILLERPDRGVVRATWLDPSRFAEADAEPPAERSADIDLDDLPAFVEAQEAGDERPRWVWDDTSAWYPAFLAAGVRVERCVDLRLCHVILRNSTLTARTRLATAEPGPWDVALQPELEQSPTAHTALFDLEQPADALAAGRPSARTELLAQEEAIAASADPGRLRLLLAAESAGALIAAELQHAGLPYRADRHDELLTELLGPRPAYGRPAVLEALTRELREHLDAPDLNPDSPPEVLKALQRAGVMAVSTRSWELRKLEHPVIEPLLRYKKLSRLLTANGWAWLDAWIRDGRFRPDYIPGGVVTGRWATRGGGALQLPKQVRSAVVADPGWKLVVADAAQLEPRILTALSGDEAMAAAGRGKDLYEGIVASGAVDERAHAKVAMLGAMYGATTGESGRLMPRLTRAFPAAIRLVEDAARAGERGEKVTSRLGRSSPLPGPAWDAAQAAASGPDSTEADERRARSQARDWGRFTRNFVVQASAAEWALCWMAELRNRLTALVPGAVLTDAPHLVYFLHDEVIVHTPEQYAEEVVAAVHAAAGKAGRLLFGGFPVEFPVTAAVVDSYADAK